jgi:hypothetical protein
MPAPAKVSITSILFQRSISSLVKSGLYQLLLKNALTLIFSLKCINRLQHTVEKQSLQIIFESAFTLYLFI